MVKAKKNETSCLGGREGVLTFLTYDFCYSIDFLTFSQNSLTSLSYALWKSSTFLTSMCRILTFLTFQAKLLTFSK